MLKRLLLIDIGNSNLKWALLEQGRLSSVSSFSHRGVMGESLAEQCWGDLARPDAVYLASVAEPGLRRQIDQWMQDRWQSKPEPVRSQAFELGVVNGYDNPDQLGVDRWLTLLAARVMYARAVCIVDCGTALTIDLLGADGRHHGGMILPGLHLMRDALLAQTHIPKVTEVQVGTLFANDTATAVASAALNAAAGLIDRSLQEAARLCGDTPLLLLTGSDAKTIATAINHPHQIDDKLIMKGLAAIAEARERQP